MPEKFPNGCKVKLIEMPSGTLAHDFEAVVGNEYEVVIRFGCCLNVRDLKSGATSIINADRFAPTQA